MTARPHARWRPPAEFDEYRLLEPLGRGAMGQVWLGHDTLLDRLVAIKFIAEIDPDALSRQRFMLEARAIARLSHPNVVAVYRVGEVADRPFIVSEYVRGKPLGPVPPSSPESLEIVVGLTRGLAAAHRDGVLHRDLKPENAIVSETGEVKLLDFGLAKFVDAARVTESRPRARIEDSDGALDATLATDGREPSEIDAVVTIDRREPPEIDATARLGDAEDGADTSDNARTLLQVPERSGRRDIDDSSNLTAVGAVLGTPLYIAPEIWKGEPATTRSDVYSLGAVLFHILSGKPPHLSGRITQLAATVTTTDAAPLSEVVSDIDPELAAVVDRCLRRDPAERYSSAEEVREELERLTPEARAAELPEGNPYPGLQAFDVAFRGAFFGRGADVRAVIERLRNDRLVVIAGDSGVGKSSLCRAGVLPAIEEGALGDGRSWTSARITPGHHPLGELASRMALLVDLDEDELIDQLRDDPAGAARSLKRHLSEQDGVALLVDQTEELVTLSDGAERDAFSQALVALAIHVPGLRILCTVRGDYLTAVAALPGLGDEVTRSLHLLRPMTSAGLRDAITGPARAKGVSFENVELVDQLVEATGGAGALPLLQFTLAELWDKRDPESKVIAAETLEAIGGVEGALTRHADAVVETMLPIQRAAARQILSRLVTTEGTRTRLDEGELASDDAAREALRQLVQGRLLVVRQSEDATTYEVAHEALIERWVTLRDWLDERQELRAARERVERAAGDWERLENPSDALWSQRQVGDLPPELEAELNDAAREFLSESRRAIRRRRAVRRGTIALVVAALVGGYALFGWLEARKLERRVAGRLERAATIAAEARTSREALERQRAAAFALFDKKDREAAETEWDRAQALLSETEARYGDAAQSFEAALILDSSRREVKDKLAEILYERAELSDEVGRTEERDEALRRLQLYDADGRWQARWNQPASVAIATTPAGATATLGRYRLTDGGRRELVEVEEVGETPLELDGLAPGSYLLTLRAPGRADVRYPFVVERGADERFAIDMLPNSSVPPGMLHVPAGRFFFGVDVDDGMRRNYYQTAPLHPVDIHGFLAAQHETTYGEWFEFLRALPPKEREARMPKSATIGMTGAVSVAVDSGRFSLTIQPAGTSYRVSEGESLRYTERDENAIHPVTRLPVSGISPRDAEAFAGYLRDSGKVSGARLCTEREWERLARGADSRIYPHGSVLRPKDANFGPEGSNRETYGPDQVGSHPRSRSPFGADDLAGNVWEWAVSVYDGTDYVARGGAYQFDAAAATAVKHEAVASNLRDITVGIRICADLPQ